MRQNECLKTYSRDVPEEGVLRPVDPVCPKAEVVQIYGVFVAAVKRSRRTIPNLEKVARNVARVSGGKISSYSQPQYLESLSQSSCTIFIGSTAENRLQRPDTRSPVQLLRAQFAHRPEPV